MVMVSLSRLAVRISEKGGLFHHEEIFSIGGMVRWAVVDRVPIWSHFQEQVGWGN